VRASDGTEFSVCTAAAGENSHQHKNTITAAQPSATPAPGTPSSSEKVQLSSSTDMMLNHVQGELVQPQGKFRALQMSDGNGLLFSIDSSDTFTVIKENVGKTQTGWTVNDISSRIIEEKFPGGKVHAFDVAQSVAADNSIVLGMSVRVGESDTLVLSMSNSPNSNSPWISDPVWLAFPFDAKDPPSAVHITNIYFSETDQNQQYILVDILRNPGSALKDTARYIVNPMSQSGPHWMPHELPFDVEEGTYQSCMGRPSGAYIDGVYTSGTVAGVAQLAYVPLFNLSGNAAPMPTRLRLPEHLPTTAIASARNGDKDSENYGTTELYAIGGSTLYIWDADQQLDDGTMGTKIMTNSVFAGTDTLIAVTRDKVTTLFGKNADDMVYYTSCSVDKLTDPKSWSMPVPILSGIERITSYINVRDGGNTIYAAGGDKIQQVTQATKTSSKVWQAQGLTLATHPRKPALQFKSYTTIIKATKANGLSSAGIQVHLTTQYRTPVYINGLYYVLSEVPVTVKTDQMGLVAVIQATQGLVDPVINAKLGDIAQTINPMKGSFSKLGALANKDSLKQAQITTNTTAGGVIGAPSTTSLVSSSISENDLEAAANSIKILGAAYDAHTPGGSGHATSVHRMADADFERPQHVETMGLDIMDVVKMAAGDVFN
jgi:hypothetical protein